MQILEQIMNNVKLETKISNQRKELHRLNERCRLLATQIKVIQDIDYYKSRMAMIKPNTAYKAILCNARFSREIETLFNKPFNECLVFYGELLNYRNQIVHKYTLPKWISDKKYYRQFTKKSLSQLEASQ